MTCSQLPCAWPSCSTKSCLCFTHTFPKPRFPWPLTHGSLLVFLLRSSFFPSLSCPLLLSCLLLNICMMWGLRVISKIHPEDLWEVRHTLQSTPKKSWSPRERTGKKSENAGRGQQTGLGGERTLLSRAGFLDHVSFALQHLQGIPWS